MALTEAERKAEATKAMLDQKQRLLDNLLGRIQAVGDLATVLARTSQDLTRQYEADVQVVAALRAGAGTLISDLYGEYSLIDQLLRREREAGLTASTNYIKAHPECRERDAADAWAVAGKAATGLTSLVQDPLLLGEVFRGALLALGLITTATWEAQRTWVVATSPEEILRLWSIGDQAIPS